MKIRKPSFTALDTFSRCPQQYARNLVFGRSPDTPQIQRGHHVHECLEETAKHALDHACGWRESIDAILAAPPDGFLSQEELESYLNRAFEVVQFLEPVRGGVEMWFDDIGAPWGLPVLPVCGKIDLVSETTLVCSEQARPYKTLVEPGCVDYKTISNERRVKAPWEAKRSMQLKTYCLATGFDRGGFVYLLPQKTEEARAQFVQFTEEDLRIAHTWISRQLECMLSCWRRFLGVDNVAFGTEVELPESPDWDAWSLSHPDNILCSPKWCHHYNNCLKGVPNV